MPLASDPVASFTAAERRVLGLLAVPPAPELPEGSPGSIQVFRAGDNYYQWSLLVWAIRCGVVFILLTTVSVAVVRNLDRVAEWARIAWTTILAVGWAGFAVTAVVTLIARRLSYRLRWYIVTDRCLRIRSGVFQINELTMTYGNIQEIRVSGGPLQRLLGLADVEVQAAGGGDRKQGADGHTGRFEGLANADAIRDLMVERLKHYRDSGLGDAIPHQAAAGSDADELTAATALLEEARRLRAILAVVVLVFMLTAGSAFAQTCAPLSAANAAASAGTPNINHDGTPIAGTSAPDISKGFQGIPRSAQPALTDTQQRIQECTYHLAEANADMPFTLFVPTRYRQGSPNALIVDLHGLNITPLQQILFDGTTDFAERFGFIVVAPMGFNVSAGWGGRVGPPIATAQTKPGSPGEGTKYSASELAEIDATTLLKLIREKYTIDGDRIFLMGHSLGGAGTYYLGGKYNDIWAGLAPLSGAGGIANAEAAQKYKSIPTLIMHGERDSIVPAATSRRAVIALQSIGAPHIYLEFPGKDHEFWIRRGAENMEKVFLFFSMLSKRTNPGFLTAPGQP